MGDNRTTFVGGPANDFWIGCPHPPKLFYVENVTSPVSKK